MDAWKIKKVGPHEISVKLPKELFVETGGKNIPPDLLARAITKWLKANPGAGTGTRCEIRAGDGTEWKCGIRSADGMEAPHKIRDTGKGTSKCGIRSSDGMEAPHKIRDTGKSTSKCRYRASDGTEWPT